MTRVALAPIKDSQLNLAPNTPLRKQPKVLALLTPVVKPVVKPLLLFRTSPRKSPTKLSVFRSPHSQRVDKAAGQLRRQLQMAVLRVKALAPLAPLAPAPLTRPASAPTVATLAALARALPTRRHSRPKVSLTSIARRRLRIYRVKKTLLFYQLLLLPLRLPLTGAKVSLPRIACHDMDHQRFILPYAAAAALAAGAQPLPLINIILKTPIRNAQGRAPGAPGALMARSRLALLGALAVAPGDASSLSAALTEDTTIDDDDTTIANVTATGDDLAVKRAERRRPVLTLLPLQNPLGTPSSFLVAKLLLQLAGNM